MNMGPYQFLHPRYRLLERIGKGGMGEVFRTQDRLTGQVVALKRVRIPQKTARPMLPRFGEGATSLGQAATMAPEAQAPGAAVALLSTSPGSSLGQDFPPAVAWVDQRHEQPRPRASSQAAERTLRPIELSETMEAPSATSDVGHAASVAAFEPTSSPEHQALRLHLTQEFRTLAGLRHPHIVSVLDYGFDRDHQPYFTMELLAAAAPLHEAAGNQSVAGRVRLLLQILQALTYLHRRGVLHRDLKPGNILVVSGPQGPQVKLLDFGLAMLTQDLRIQFAEVAGTIGYMAPEILLGCPPNVASDLFAVGVMAHELLVGSHPLGGRPTAALIQEFLGTAPLFSENERLGAALSGVLRRALCRAQGERYSDAVAFGQDLARAAGLPPPVESIEIRESFLQAATFVARQEELVILHRALDAAVSNKGSVWLIGGESGVGKSRLLEELRTLALVRGVRVVRGQAVSAASAAYQVWQAALRPLCLDTPIDALDAGVLQAVVPDIATLLERAVANPPALDPQSAQKRLLYAIERLLASQKEPLLILLEDLHWSEPTSLAVLLHFVRLASLSRLPILIVGSYRNDERPDLPSELPGAQSLNLARLPAQEIAALSASMLGDVGTRADVLELLARETEGNAFFIVEVVRALAEEVGALERIGTGRIPSRVVAGGIQALLARRLRRVAADARPFLSAAAVLGRELDLAVLRLLPGELGRGCEADLQACTAAAVLEAHENRWRFAHDKLREAVLAELEAAERVQWHLVIGQAIERAYAADLGPHAAALAYHFNLAGESTRAVRYSVQGGERALQSGAVQEALAHLEEARKLNEGSCLTKTERVHLLGLLCQGYVSAGRPEEAAQTLEQMLTESGISVPRSARHLAVEIAHLLVRHAAYRLRLGSDTNLAPLDSAERSSLGEVADAYVASIGTVGYSRTQAQYFHLSLALVTLAERLADPVRLASAYTALASILSLLPLDWLTDDYLQRARALLAQSPEPLAGELALRRGSAWVFTNRGEWAAALTCLNEEMEHYRRVGDIGAELLALAQRFRLDESRGDIAAFREAQARMEMVAQRVESAQHLCWVWSTRGFLAMHAGDLERARQSFLEAEKYAPRARDRFVSLYLGSNSALCALRCGDREDARRRADATLHELRTTPSFGSSVADALAPLVETYFLLWSKSLQDMERDELHLRLRQSLAAFRGMAAAFPICRPRALLWHGQYAVRRKQHRLGEWLLRRACEAAQRYRMPFDEGLAHLALSEVADSHGDGARAQEARQKASVLFARVEAYFYLAPAPSAQTNGG